MLQIRIVDVPDMIDLPFKMRDARWPAIRLADTAIATDAVNGGFPGSTTSPAHTRKIHMMISVWLPAALLILSIPPSGSPRWFYNPALLPVQNDAPAAAVKPDLAALNALSGNLVERARGGRADATRFRIDATLYRETLRRLMLGSADTESNQPDSGGLHLQMVRMAALLNAAAECKTGRYITCPPELMRQLDAQQRLLNQEFARRFKQSK